MPTFRPDDFIYSTGVSTLRFEISDVVGRIKTIEVDIAKLKEAFSEMIDAIKPREGESEEDAKQRVSQFLFGAE